MGFSVVLFRAQISPIWTKPIGTKPTRAKPVSSSA